MFGLEININSCPITSGYGISLGVKKIFWNVIVVMFVQPCEYTTELYPLKGEFYGM